MVFHGPVELAAVIGKVESAAKKDKTEYRSYEVTRLMPAVVVMPSRGDDAKGKHANPKT